MWVLLWIQQKLYRKKRQGLPFKIVLGETRLLGNSMCDELSNYDKYPCRLVNSALHAIRYALDFTIHTQFMKEDNNFIDNKHVTFYQYSKE